MSAGLTAQVVVNGVLLGGLYACMAIGLSLIWGVMGVINLAHGSMIVVGSYITYALTTQLHIDPFISVPVSALALFALGYLLQRHLLDRVSRESVFLAMIVTFGLDMLLVNTLHAGFTANQRSIRPSYADAGLDLGDVRVAATRLAVFAIAVVLTLALSVFLDRTRTGQAIKATSFDLDAARLVGVDTRRVHAVTFGIGAAMAGIAGSLLAVVSSFSPGSGMALTMRSFVVVVLGGLGSVPGTIAGGIMLGVVEGLTVITLASGWVNVVAFAVFLLVLVLRPRGLFGRRFYAEI
jgi:branched-chain amino acid transport system permease protein